MLRLKRISAAKLLKSREGDKIDFSKFRENDYVAYNVVAQDPNYTKRYILKIAVLPVAQEDQYTFTEWAMTVRLAGRTLTVQLL